MRVLIVDDEAPARARLRHLLGGFEQMHVVGEAADGAAALALCALTAPDAVFLDMQMPEVNGFDVAASLPDGGPALVFMSAFDPHALRAFDADAADYLLKPVDPQRLARAVQRLRSGARPAIGVPTRLLVPERGRTQVVPCTDIHWLQCADTEVSLHLPGRALLMQRTLAALLQDLGPGFMRIHHGTAVALARVQALRSSDHGDATVVLQGGTELPCSRQYRAALWQHLQR